MKEERVIGVGPHSRPWPIGVQFDEELLKNGDTRNVEDKYRYWTVEAIKADMQRRAAPLEVAIENWQHDNNIGTIVRTANAFNVQKVHIIGKRHWNRRGAMVTDRYMAIEHHEQVDHFLAAAAGKTLIAVDNIAGATALSEASFPANSVLVFGGEGPGLSAEMREACDQLVMIEQYGSTRSINVGVAAGILMYEWNRQQKMPKT